MFLRRYFKLLLKSVCLYRENNGIKKKRNVIITFFLAMVLVTSCFHLVDIAKSDPLIENLALNAPITGQSIGDDLEYVNDGDRYTYAYTGTCPEHSIATVDITLPDEAEVFELYWKIKLWVSSFSTTTARLQVMENNSGNWQTIQEHTDLSTGEEINEYVSFSSKYVTKARIWASVGSEIAPWNRWNFYELEVWSEVPRVPDEPCCPVPVHGKLNVSTNPTLSVNVSDPDGDNLNVSFYEYDPTCFTIDAEQDWLNGSFCSTETDGMGNLRLLEPSNTVAYGDGSDGSYTVTADKTLNGNKNYTYLTIQPGITLDTAGYTLRVSETLTNYGTITDTVSGGSGGNGGSGGDGGYHNGPIDNQPPENGHCGSNGQPGSCLTAGHGGDGGDGGGGGGSAWHTWTSNNAHGGNGGDGGDGGDGGGHVMIYTNTLNNQGTIHANGFSGQNGQNGENGQEVDFTYLLDNKDLCGGGGGGGSAGDGGDGGSVDLVYNSLLTSGTVSAQGGNAGNRGLGGYGPCCEHGVNNGNYDFGANGCGSSGDGGRGEYRENMCAENGDDAINAAENGDPGIVVCNDSYYVSSGNYYKIFNAGAVAHWYSFNDSRFVPSSTCVTIAFAENTTTGDPTVWKWYNNIDNIPDCQWLKINISLSSFYHSVTPTISEFTVCYQYRLIGIDENVESGSIASCQWFDLQLQTLYEWFAVASDPLGFTNCSTIWNFTTRAELSNQTQVSFLSGWNLFTISVETSWNASDLLSNVSDATMLSWYDTLNETYKTATSGGGYDFPLQCGWGYFVYVTNESNVTVDGSPCENVSVPIDIGWNMIGWYHEHNTTANSLMENISNCTMVSWYDPISQTYKTRTSNGGYDFTITQNMGVFVYTTEASIWYGEG